MRKMETTIDLAELLNKNTIDPIQYQYFKNLEKRTIVINDDITSNIVEMALLPLMELDNDNTGEEITILLNTCGGEVYNGFSLVDYIEKIKTKTTIKVLGMAASMGALISMAGRNNPNVKTICSPFSVFLVHSGSDCMAGNTNAIKDMFHFSEKYEEKISKYILSHTKISEEEYIKMTRYEWWMTSEEALEKGLVDEIV